MSGLSAEIVHWIGEAPTSLHGNGAASFARGSGDEDEVTCALCHTLLARGEHLLPASCRTCGPTTSEQHPRRSGVTRCSNCKEWLTTPPTSPTGADQ